MNKLGPVNVGGTSPVRIMGILNTSPESFYKKSIKKGKEIARAVQQMEQDGADFVDVGAMSTAPYLTTLVSEKQEIKRITDAVKQIQNASNLPISIDTCRSGVAKAALDLGADIINDVTGLKYDKEMINTIAKTQPSLVLCAYGKKPLRGNLVAQTKLLLKESITLAKSAGIPTKKITLDPAVGFFRKTGKNPFYTKINSDWYKRDLEILQNLRFLKSNFPILVSVSNKSFIGKVLDRQDPSDRIFGSIAAEVISVLNGADIIRTHNVRQTKDAITIAEKFSRKFKKGL
ncbi:dihydropteroate synthase [Candidatus Nitrosotenuis chungbukensis]|uniref:dihydropteroate synthase n=1 Tax=Candidatus Nitrosotenuis chungbukensis TaxID=1353246 RepID=UPI0005B2B306|nr:dihydropteroate synthase [Candidatus Nitrosotenuis chungbukensis]WKT58710.1 dihydropteroate synthase [Candidatus Nitrosotenuis chungbukensis]